MQITLRTQNIAQDVVAFDLMFKVQVPNFFILLFFFFWGKEIDIEPSGV